MSEALTIANIDDAILYALEALRKDHDFVDFSIGKNLDIEIVFNGDFWDGKIDYKICQIILALQSDILGIFKKATGKNVSISSDSAELKQLSVKVSIEKNCTKILAQLSNIISHLKELGMTSKQASVIILAVLATATAISLTPQVLSFIERRELAENQFKERIARIDADQKDKERLEKITMRALDAAFENTRAPQRISTALETNDKVTINGTTFTKAEAIKSFTKEENIDAPQKPLTFIVDGSYKIVATFMEKQKVDIAYRGAKTFSASTKDVSPAEKQQIYKIFAEADAMGFAPTIDIQMRVEVLNGDITSAIIEKIGAPRSHAINLFKALSESLPKEKGKGIAQAHLLE